MSQTSDSLRNFRSTAAPGFGIAATAMALYLSVMAVIVFFLMFGGR